jgi:eukaryotic-like serine/threonine-protein kinase
MNWLSDQAVSRLQAASALPDLGGTRYRLVKRIGRGGMGAVYLAEDSVLGRRVALKVLDVPGEDGELTARLLREAHILARLEHPGIVPVHDAGTLADGRVFYAMKYVEGERLDRLAQGTASLPERLRLFQRICEAVGFAHARGILHRDLKPENVMVGPFGEVLVMDWGIAKILRGARESGDGEKSGSDDSSARAFRCEVAIETEHGSILGTPGYMAPEQARGDVEHLDERAQLLGIVIGSTVKGLIAGVLIGWFARKVNSLALGILFGLGVGLVLAFIVAHMQGKYYLEIMTPGGLVGLIVGYATQKYGAATASTPARTRA